MQHLCNRCYKHLNHCRRNKLSPDIRCSRCERRLVYVDATGEPARLCRPCEMAEEALNAYWNDPVWLARQSLHEQP